MDSPFQTMSLQMVEDRIAELRDKRDRPWFTSENRHYIDRHIAMRVRQWRTKGGMPKIVEKQNAE